MALKARYTNANGRLIAEKRTGVRSFYMADGIGSTRALLDNTQTKTDTFTYWPYGEEKSRTGTIATPFRYIGALGNYRDTSGRAFARHRSYQSGVGRWMTKDPLLVLVDPYGYSFGNPTTLADASGLAPEFPSWPNCPEIGPIECNYDSNERIYKYCNCCYSGPSGIGRALCALKCHIAANAYYRKCKGTPGNGMFSPMGRPGEVGPTRFVSESAPCFGIPLDCRGNYDDIEECVGMGWGEKPSKLPVLLPPKGQSPAWSYYVCIGCCESMFLTGRLSQPSRDPQCATLYKQCTDRCREYSSAFAFFFFTDFFSKFASFYDPPPYHPNK